MTEDAKIKLEDRFEIGFVGGGDPVKAPDARAAVLLWMILNRLPTSSARSVKQAKQRESLALEVSEIVTETVEELERCDACNRDAEERIMLKMVPDGGKLLLTQDQLTDTRKIFDAAMNAGFRPEYRTASITLAAKLDDPRKIQVRIEPTGDAASKPEVDDAGAE